ncbi:hypothetical protein [Cryptosporangium sp. NPDC051539]|uniref:hypothetical protein n=1 Tax=Cryptosporangium sp. NPDC051539 TaxID=3363962 RepID=UPI003792B298
MTSTPEQYRAALTLLRTCYANLIAAARATLAAHADGEADPLYYLRDELTEHPTLPPHPDTVGGSGEQR